MTRRHFQRRFALPLFLLLLAVGLPVLDAPQASAAPAQEYIALGDSIAAGLITSLPSTRGYPELVTDQLQQLEASQAQPAAVQLENLAVPGETDETFLANGQLQAFKNQIASARSQGSDIPLITITLGGNDLLQLQDLGTSDRQAGLNSFRSSYPAAINAVRQALGDLKPMIVVTTYYDVSESDPTVQGSDGWWVAQFNDVITSIAKNDGLQVADVASAFRGHISQWTWYPLDVHPNNAGHEEIAKLVWQAAGLDAQPPVVTIVKPSAGKLARPIPTISVTATDNVGVTDVQLWVDGVFDSSLIYEPSLKQYVGVWDGSSDTAQHATLSVHATDFAGHTTTADVTVTLPSP